MDPNSLNVIQGAAGAAGGGDPAKYVEEVFNTDLWDGTGSTHSITNDIDLTEGGLVWTKVRDADDNHYFADSERGKTGTYFDELTSSSNYSSQTNRSWGITSFNSDGFSCGGDNNQFNSSSYEYASWSFRKAPGFFDVVTYTGNSTAGREISHALGSTPGMVIVKRTNLSAHWVVWHRSTGEGYFKLNATDGFSSSDAFIRSATSSNFTLGSDGDVNSTGNSYVAYIFAHDDERFGDDEDESIIKCGTFSGNATDNAIDLGWEPQWLMVKRSDTPSNSGHQDYTSWLIQDNMRGFGADGDTGHADHFLWANGTAAEGVRGNLSGGVAHDYAFIATPTGFRTENGGQVEFNHGSPATYIYMAIRRGPMKTPEDATKVFHVYAATENATNPWTPGFVPDLFLYDRPDEIGNSVFGIRLLGAGNSLRPEVTTAEDVDLNNENFHWDSPNGTFEAGWFGGTTYYLRTTFKRAPGFMDIVTYTGTGSATAFSHNLGVKPELVIFKSRSHNQDWIVKFQDRDNMLYMNDTTGYSGGANYFDAEDTATTFYGRAGNAMSNNSGYDYVAYLFATCPGVSKVGSYTSNGNARDIDCGFDAGARFVMIKRTDSSTTGDWFIWDSVRGYSGSTDNFLKMNSTAAQDSNYNNIDDHLGALSAGFSVTASSVVNINTADYIYLAIA